jgi:hypothetical protein
MCKATAKLSDSIGSENADNLIDMIGRAIDRAIHRQAEQDVTIMFNKAGNVQKIKGSDTVNGVKPKAYTPE